MRSGGVWLAGIGTAFFDALFCFAGGEVAVSGGRSLPRPEEEGRQTE
jgi:hypothetical protein